MTVYNEKTKRRVVPRWRSSIVAASAKDFQPLKPTPQPAAKTDDGTLLDQIEQFKESPDLGRAAELLSTGIRVGDSAISRNAATFIHNQGPLAPAILLEAAVAVLNGAAVPFVSKQIADDAKAIAYLRRLLSLRPRSANLWVDLARHQAALGETIKAQRSMQVALALAPDHRWVLRSANRLLLHAGKSDAAHKLIANHPRSRADPWLMAAEIASAQLAKRPSKFAARAKDLLRPKHVKTTHLSELAAAVATLELESGSNKSARRLFSLALGNPTENALAQVEWAEREVRSGLDLEPIVKRTPDAYEASCWLQYNEGQIEAALHAAREWLLDESYATRPVGMVCYLASFLDDYETVIKTSREALTRHPNETLHRNNLIFGLFSDGAIFYNKGSAIEITEHVDFLRRRINGKEDDAFHATANAALFFYRNGQLDEGKQLYEATMDAADLAGNQLIRAHAAVMNSREALLAAAPWAKEALDIAHKLTKKVVSPGLAFYLRKLDSLAANPAAAAEILAPSAAKRFSPPKRFVNPLKDFRLERTPSGPVLWVPRHFLRN